MTGMKEEPLHRGSETDVEKDVEKSVIEKTPTESEEPGNVSQTNVLQQNLSPAKVRITVAALCLACLLSAMDQSIISTALPVIAQEFHSSSAYTWVGSAYLLATAASGPNWGKTSDIFGRKPIIFAAVTLFLIGSIMCATAKDIGTLIAGRAVAGAGGGGINLLALICVADIVPIERRSLYVGFISAVWAFATSIGPTLGGVFTSKVTWRWCFWINLPIGGLALVVLYFFLHIKTKKISLVEGLKQIDWSGTFLVVPGTILVLLGLETGGVVRPWDSALVICCLVFGMLLWVLFLVNEKYVPKRPIMPLQLFKNRSNLAALGVCFCHGLLFIAGPYYLPLYFQAVLGKSPILSGVLLLPYNGILSVGSLGASFIINKTGRYWYLIILAMAFAALGHGLMINLPLNPGWAKIIIYTMIAGFGIGPNFQSPLIAFQSETAKEHIATGTSSYAFTRTTATSASIVIGGAIFQNSMKAYTATLVDVLGKDLGERLSGGSAQANVGLIPTLTPDQQVLVKGFFLKSISNIWIYCAAAGGVGMLISLFVKNNRLHDKKDKEAEEAAKDS